MLLSIVMMMKNEEKYLNKTLTALQPLMKMINSELIILDTGSTDKSIDIAKKFTDKVYFKQWNNNFADMRNESISYAQGDWIFILDADEELTDYKKMIEFFNSDKCKKYNCASIELKNILSEDIDDYSKGSIPRLFKYNKKFSYKGAIHEQPIYQKPIYNDIASFNHYGYIYINEELKQKKIKRNEIILLSELKINPNDPYLNFQMGKNHMAEGKVEEALHYMEKAYKIYKDLGIMYVGVYMNLASLYIRLYKFDKSEKMCLRYIKKDDKNIDIYYYLALSQKSLGKYKDSLVNYNRYIFLLENYELSTQANDVCCDADTVRLRDSAEIELINIYYSLEMYDEIIKKAKKIEFEQIKKVHSIIFMSLYRLNRLEEIIDLYSMTSGSIVEKKDFKLNLEKMILMIKESDREKVYKLLSNIDDNYGLLNQIRLGKKLTVKEYSEILLKEKEMYYGDIVYYAFKQDIDLIKVLNEVSHLYIQNYMNYIITNRRDCILDLYEYLLNAPNTLDINKLSIYSSLSKSLLFGGNLMDEKYEKLFLMYVMYKYDYLRQIYNENLTDEELLIFVTNEEERFIINIITIQKIKEIDKIKYIKQIKALLIDNPQYKKGIQILINKFEKELNESGELKQLKMQYKSIIENSINNGKFDEAILIINEYETMFSQEVEILNMKSIIALLNNDFIEAEMFLKKALLLDSDNSNTIFNIAYLKEVIGETKEAIKFYNNILSICEDESVVTEVKEKINAIK